MSVFADRIAEIKARYDQCFGCGMGNPIGLHLDDFVPDGPDGIATSFTPRAEYRGFDGVLHGGVLATALDETLAWTAMLRAEVLVVTATLQLKYRAPADPTQTFRVSGRIAERRGKRLRLEGRVAAGPDVVAEASGLFLVTGPLPSATG